MPFSAVRVAAVVALSSTLVATMRAQSQDEPRFTGGVELVNVTATVTDRDGRFASGLRPILAWATPSAWRRVAGSSIVIG